MTRTSDGEALTTFISAPLGRPDGGRLEDGQDLDQDQELVHGLDADGLLEGVAVLVLERSGWRRTP